MAEPELARLARRVASHEDDIRAIADTTIDILGTVERHTRVLDGHTRVLNEHTRRLDGIDRTLGEHGRALVNLQGSQAAMQETLAGHGEQLSSVQGSLAEILRRLEAR